MHRCNALLILDAKGFSPGNKAANPVLLRCDVWSGWKRMNARRSAPHNILLPSFERVWPQCFNFSLNPCRGSGRKIARANVSTQFLLSESQTNELLASGSLEAGVTQTRGRPSSCRFSHTRFREKSACVSVSACVRIISEEEESACESRNETGCTEEQK